jgi:cytochrome c oxidase subunit 2
MTGAFPGDASIYAGEWDRFFAILIAISAIIVAAIFIVIVGFSIRYRRGSKAKRGMLPEVITNELELSWTAATAIAFIFMFWWVAMTQLKNIIPPEHPLEIHVLAKQWMWKVQQPNGVREIDELHAPVGRAVELIMTSQDVIHSLFLPALRLKKDVLPGRYTYLWFTANKPGIYHLFCSLGCSGCHAPSSSVHAPDLNGMFGHKVQLADGRTVTADEAYLRDSILLPQKDVVAGFEPIMPSFRGIVDDDDMVKLMAYLKSLPSKRDQP